MKNNDYHKNIKLHRPCIHAGVALMLACSKLPPKVFASFLFLPSNFYLYFSLIAVVFSSSLLFT